MDRLRTAVRCLLIGPVDRPALELAVIVPFLRLALAVVLLAVGCAAARPVKLRTFAQVDTCESAVRRALLAYDLSGVGQSGKVRLAVAVVEFAIVQGSPSCVSSASSKSERLPADQFVCELRRSTQRP
jgi:hypothetical protein